MSDIGKEKTQSRVFLGDRRGLMVCRGRWDEVNDGGGRQRMLEIGETAPPWQPGFDIGRVSSRGILRSGVLCPQPCMRSPSG